MDFELLVIVLVIGPKEENKGKIPIAGEWFQCVNKGNISEQVRIRFLWDRQLLKGRIKLNKREVAEVSCKILAIYTIFDCLSKEIAFIYGIFIVPLIIHVPGQTNHSNELFDDFVSSAQYLVRVLFGIALWFLAKKIATKIGKEEYSEDVKIPIGDMRNIAFSILGLFFIGISLADIVGPIVNFRVDWPSLGGLVRVVVQLVFGLLLLLYAQGLVRFFNKTRKSEVNQGNIDSEN